MNNINLLVCDANFNSNIAYSTSKYYIYQAEGGAISINCSDLENCILILQNNSFYDNHADINGGAIWWSHIMSSDSNNTTLYGNDTASLPISFHLKYQTNSKFQDICKFQAQVVLGRLEEFKNSYSRYL